MTSCPKLFVVCPECNIEPRIRELFGDQIYFVTALGLNIAPDQLETVATINYLLSTVSVDEVILAVRVGCKAINKSLPHGRKSKLDVFLEQGSQNSDFECATKDLADNVRKKLTTLKEVTLEGNAASANAVEVSGLVFSTDLSEQSRIELRYN